MINQKRAHEELEIAALQNPGPWKNHSEYVAKACYYIAKRCKGMDADLAYIYGLLHDIGRREGISKEKRISDFDMNEQDYQLLCHVIDNAVYDDYDYLVQLCDSLALPTGFCLLETRFVDVGIRYGTVPVMGERWKKVFEIKGYFEKKVGSSIYELLPGIKENFFSLENQ